MPKLIIETIVNKGERLALYPVGQGYCVWAEAGTPVEVGDLIQYDEWKQGEGYYVSNMSRLSQGQGHYTVKQVAKMMKMTDASIRRYIMTGKGAYTPHLEAIRGIDERGHDISLIPVKTFEAWRAEYKAKKPFGSRLKLDNRLKTGE